MPPADLISLHALQQSRVLSATDRHLAELLGRLTKDTNADAQLALALASQWPQRGHVCLDLQTLTPDQLWEHTENPLRHGQCTLPDLSIWLDSLRASSAVGDPETSSTPFVLRDERWLYLRRYYDYEQDIVEKLSAWMTQDAEMAPIPHGGDGEAAVASLFGVASFDSEDHQHQAVLQAAQHRCFVLTGGPGTGKTTTVVRMLALLLMRTPHLEIALTAPTGKAALRLQESIRRSVEALPCDRLIKSRMPKRAQTLHRLLGYQRFKTTFRHDRDRPLSQDLVVVDEASMMGIGMMAKLLRALRPSARLLLVGDRHQLPAVDTGAIFEALSSATSGLPKVELTRNYRFSQSSGMGALADAVKQGDTATAQRLLDTEATATCRMQSLPPVDQFGSALWSTLSELLKPLQTLHDPEAAFAHFAGYQALCAHRTGPYGSVMVNALLEEALARHFNLPAEQRWHVGRPIVITENDYAVDLFNGDTGILLPWKGKLAAFFRSPEGGFRQIPPARLPAHESAYALTIHKSQGSEFDQVLLILTDQASPILSRELLYTGITRARSRVEVWGTSESLQACVERPLKRTLHLESHCPAPANPSLASS